MLPLPSISESGPHTRVLSLDEDENVGSDCKPPIIPRITASSQQVGMAELSLSGYSFLDTLADIASQSSPLKSKFIKGTEMSLRNRPRASSEPWLSSFITRQMEDSLQDIEDQKSSFPTNKDSLTGTAGSSSWEETEVDDEGDNDAALPSATLPQMLEKYSAIYNKNGRIGIYTREERNDMISRFHEKRKRRVWKKKIRYHCRKNLADSRIRVKGRFVKCADDVARLEGAARSAVNTESGRSKAGDLLTCTSTTSSMKVEGGMVTETLGAISDNNGSISESRGDRKFQSNGIISNSNSDEMEEDYDENEEDNLKDMVQAENNGSGDARRGRMRRHSIAY